MAGAPKTSSMRMPLMGAFRTAFDTHDAKRRVDERDEGGERVLAGRRASGRGAISEAVLQKVVSDDLEMLMNTTNLESTLDLGDFAEARRSIINFGIPDVVHRTTNAYDIQEISGEIGAALAVFEPRLEPATIRVEADTRDDSNTLRVRFLVRADLRCDPLNLPVEFVADVERDTGKILVSSR